MAAVRDERNPAPPSVPGASHFLSIFKHRAGFLAERDDDGSRGLQPTGCAFPHRRVAERRLNTVWPRTLKRRSATHWHCARPRGLKAHGYDQGVAPRLLKKLRCARACCARTFSLGISLRHSAECR